MGMVALLKRHAARPKSQELVLRLSILALIYVYAFAIRLVCGVNQVRDCMKRTLESLSGLHAPVQLPVSGYDSLGAHDAIDATASLTAVIASFHSSPCCAMRAWCMSLIHVE